MVRKPGFPLTHLTIEEEEMAERGGNQTRSSLTRIGRAQSVTPGNGNIRWPPSPPPPSLGSSVSDC